MINTNYNNSLGASYDTTYQLNNLSNGLEKPTFSKLDNQYLSPQRASSLWNSSTERFIAKGDKKGKDSGKEGKSKSNSGNGSGNNVNVNSGNKTEVNITFGGCELDPRVAEGKDKSKSEKP